MRRKVTSFTAMLVLAVSLLSMLGAAPGQGAPPRPLYPDYFAGNVFIQGAPAPAGTQLVACIDDCRKVFQSTTVRVEAGGKYSRLVVNPTDQSLVGHIIAFYVVNEFGRIKAVETATFAGGLNPPYILNLTFSDAAPTPPPTATPAPAPVPTATPRPRPTPSLPVTGDAAVLRIPPLAVGLGGAGVFGGVFLLLLLRRRSS